MSPQTQAQAMLSWGLDQIVIVYVPRAFTKKNLKSIPPMILVMGHIFLVFGFFFFFFLRFWLFFRLFGVPWGPPEPATLELTSTHLI